jgi:hypothetical protein
MHNVKMKENVQIAHSYPENLKFPVVEEILQNAAVEDLVKEMVSLRSMMGRCRSHYCDSELMHRMDTIDLGLQETVRLLEKLGELSRKCRPRVF